MRRPRIAAALALAALAVLAAGCTGADDVGAAPSTVEYRWHDEPFRPLPSLGAEPPGRTRDGRLTLRVVVPELPPDPAVFLLRARYLERATVGGRALAVDAAGIASLRGDDVGQEIELVYASNRAVFPRAIRFAERRSLYAPILREDLPLIVVGVVLVVVGLLLSFLGLRPGSRRGAMAWIGAFCVPFGVALAAQASWLVALLGVPAALAWTAHGFATLLYPLAGAAFLRRAFESEGWRWVERGLVALVAAATALHLAGLLDITVSRVAFYPVLVALAVAACAFLAHRARRGDAGARVMLFGVAALSVIGLPDILWGMGHQILPMNTSPLGAMCFVVAMVLVVERRYVEQAMGLATSRVALEARVDELMTRQSEIEALDEELRRQVERRSRELADLLALRPGPTSDRALMAGTIVDGRYRVVATLGTGAMGAVYEVERTTDAQRLALKVMLRGTDPVRFAREGEIAARARHPNIVSVVDVGVAANGLVYLVMELVRGDTLEQARARGHDLRWAVSILADVAAGLAALHERGIVHRDLKPSNVLIDADGTARIADFGVARQGVLPTPLGDTAPATSDPANDTAPGAFVGTPLYMAPESARGAAAVGPAADVFALGLMACELLGGRYPYVAPPVFQALTAVPHRPNLGGVDPAHVEWITSALDPDPARRPKASHLADRLTAALRDAPVASLGDAGNPPGARPGSG